MGIASLTRLLDSVILIDHFNGIDRATRYLAAASGTCAVSVVTRAEVLAGFDLADESLALPLLRRFPTLGIGLGRSGR